MQCFSKSHRYDSHLFTMLPKSDTADSVLPYSAFEDKYRYNGKYVHERNLEYEIKQVIEAENKTNDTDIICKCEKKLIVTDKFKKRRASLLQRWVVMKKLGLLEQCEIFDGVNNNGQYVTSCVQRLWERDLRSYLIYFNATNDSDDNFFMGIQLNIAFFMQTIYVVN